jgi:hypothetical protein
MTRMSLLQSNQRIGQSLSYRRRRLGETMWWGTPHGRRNRRSLEQLRDSYRGERCFVMGNGPSLHKTDVTLLRDEVTIASNGIFLLFDEMGYKPTFLTVEDRLVAEDRATELNSINGTQKIFPRDLEYCLKLDEWTLYLNFAREYEDFPKFSGELDRIAYWGGTVSVLNLQLAYHLGCNPIYLIGFDHSYAVPTGVKDSPVITSEREDPNHFHPDYFGKGYRWHDPQIDRMEAGFQACHDFLEVHGVEVYNATAGGKLEIFDRVEYGSIVSVQQ